MEADRYELKINKQIVTYILIFSSLCDDFHVPAFGLASRHSGRYGKTGRFHCNAGNFICLAAVRPEELSSNGFVVQSSLRRLYRR
jgi:hypothetical protein